jgi:hypothetical protein
MGPEHSLVYSIIIFYQNYNNKISVQPKHDILISKNK